MSVNITAFEGRLAHDPDLDHTPSGVPTCEAVVLINRRVRVEGRWTDAEPTRRHIKAWRRHAGQLAALPKGTSVVVIGRVETDAWTDTETGEKRTKDLVVVESIGRGLLVPRDDDTEHIQLGHRGD